MLWAGLALYLLPFSSSPQTCLTLPQQPALAELCWVLGGSGRAFCLHDPQAGICDSLRRPGSLSRISAGFVMQKCQTNHPVCVSAAFPALLSPSPAARERQAGIQALGKLGCTTLLDGRSPLISQTFPIRKKKPEAFAYQRRIFDLRLLCCSPPGPPGSEEPCQHYRNSICKTIPKAAVECISLFKEKIFHIMACADFCDAAFFFFMACV